MPQKSVTIVYLPGLGDKNDGLRKFALGFWPKRIGIVKFVPMNWHDKTDSYYAKKARVVDAVKQAQGQVILIGESAGAAMGLVVTNEYPSVKLITLCGKIGGAKSTGEEFYESTPSFKELLPKADAIREQLSYDMKHRIITIRAYKDGFLSVRDNTLPGVEQIVLPTIGHITTISLAITLLRFKLFGAIKRLGVI